MITLLFWIWLLKLIIADIECKDPVIRHRKPWLRLTSEERLIYTEGFQLLRDNGKLETITNSHNINWMKRIHTSSLFVYYHSYIIYELETAIRDLGGKFACFALPYYDWTQDAGFEALENPKLYNSNIGGDGDPDNNYCVENNWGLGRYTTPNLCADDETPPNCCLKRIKAPNGRPFWTQSLTLSGLKLADAEDFDNLMRPQHVQMHIFVGNTNESHMNTGYSPDDPIFGLAHSYMDLVRILWMKCNQYDFYDIKSIDISEPEFYELYHPYCYERLTSAEEGVQECSKIPSLDFDGEMVFISLKDVNWSLSGKGEIITARKLFDLEGEFNIRYDLDEYYPNLKTECECNGNYNDDLTKEKEFVVSHIVNNGNGETTTQYSFYSMKVYVAILLMLTIIIYIASCFKNKKNKLIDDRINFQYDSI